MFPHNLKIISRILFIVASVVTSKWMAGSDPSTHSQFQQPHLASSVDKENLAISFIKIAHCAQGWV